jgi:hypothetical protein
MANVCFMAETSPAIAALTAQFALQIIAALEQSERSDIPRKAGTQTIDRPYLVRNGRTQSWSSCRRRFCVILITWREQYLLLNVLGAEQILAVHWITIPRSGNLNSGDLELLRPLPGSPYEWGGDRIREALSSRP